MKQSFSKLAGLSAAAGIAFFTTATPVSAQMAFDMTSNMMNTANVYTGTSAMRASDLARFGCDKYQTTRERDRCLAAASQRAKSVKRATPAPPVSQAVSTAFRVDMKVRAIAQANFDRDMRRFGGSGQLPSATKLMGLYGQASNYLSFPKDDVASALALQVAVLWELANKDDRDSDDLDINKRRFAALRKQMVALVSTNPNYVRLTEAERQAIGDRSALNGILFGLMQQSLKRPGATGEANRLAAEAVSIGKKEFGLDLTDLDITEQGLVPRDLTEFIKKYSK